jgi:signal peptidase I
MINWKERKSLKHAREVFRGAQKWLWINRDLLASRQVQDIAAKQRELEQALVAGNAREAMSRADELEKRIGGAMPAQKHPALRENIEVLLVAVLVAMAIRTFFIQPFKIPTGSMQPTLYGVYPPPEKPSLPYNNMQPPSVTAAAYHYFERIAGTIYQGRMYEAHGYRSRGDHIFVDKVSYHFRKPQRGEVVVFNTEFITERHFNRREDSYYDGEGESYVRRPAHEADGKVQMVPTLPEDCSAIRPGGGFYIKRLVGLGGDQLQIKPPFLYVNGEVLDERAAFRRIYSRQNDYSGYVLPFYEKRDLLSYQPQFLNANLTDTYTVPPRNLFVLGDNSTSSLDGRFWGPIPHKYLVGRAVFVYWPITPRFGLID